MSTLINRLFSRRHEAKRIRRRNNMQRRIQHLEDRKMFAVTSVLSDAGVLSIRGDSSSNEVIVRNASYKNQPSIRVIARDTLQSSFRTVANIPRRDVSSVTFDGGHGDDSFNAMQLTGVPLTSISGGPGNDKLMGSSGNDVFYGSPGIDSYSGFFGNDILHRNGHRGFFDDNGLGRDVTTGLYTGKMNYNELTVRNSMLYARQNPKDAKEIELYGPSGAGFAIRADSGWDITDDRRTKRTTYSANGSFVRLETAEGPDITLPASIFDHIVVNQSFKYGSHGAGVVLAGTRFDVTDAFSSVADTVAERTGMNLTLPTIGGGIALGGTLDNLGLPVAPSVPYLFATASPTTKLSLSNGNVSVTVPKTGWGISAVIDPSDEGGMFKLTSPEVSVGFGWSDDGEFVYTPDKLAKNVRNPKIAGELYVHGSGPLGSLPVDLTGEMVVDLDANNDGRMASVSVSDIGRIASGRADLGIISDAVSDIKLGMNGKLSTSLPVAGSVSVDVALGTGSLFWTPPRGSRPGKASFKATSSNPFKNTSFDTYLGGQKFNLEGWFETDGDFRVTGKSSSKSMNLKAGSLSVGSVSQSMEIDFQKQGRTVELEADLAFSAKIGDMNWLGAKFDLESNIDFLVNSRTGRVSVNGRGSVDAKYVISGIDAHMNNLGVSFNNDGVKVDMPGGSLLDFSVKW